MDPGDSPFMQAAKLRQRGSENIKRLDGLCLFGGRQGAVQMGPGGVRGLRHRTLGDVDAEYKRGRAWASPPVGW